MPVAEVIGDAPIAEIDKPEIGQAVDELGAVVSGIVVLMQFSMRLLED